MRRPNDAGSGGDAGDWGRGDDPAESSHAFDGNDDEPHQSMPTLASSSDPLWLWRSQRLCEVVLAWSVDQILNKDLLRDKVSKIPETFNSMEHYMTSFFGPLLEEVRGDMSSSMDDISGAPYARVLSVNATRKGKGMYEMKLDRWRGGFHGCGTDGYRPKAADVLLITETRPANQSSILKQSKSCVVVWIDKVQGNKVTVKASRRMETGADGDERQQMGVNKYEKLYAEDLDKSWEILDQEAMAQKSKKSCVNEKGRKEPPNGRKCLEKCSDPQEHNDTRMCGNSSKRWSFYAMHLTNMITYDRVWISLRRGLTMHSEVILNMLGKNNYASSYCSIFRHCLWILGNGTTLLASNSIWADLVKDSIKRECFFDALKDKDLAETMRLATKRSGRTNNATGVPSWSLRARDDLTVAGSSPPIRRNQLPASGSARSINNCHDRQQNGHDLRPNASRPNRPNFLAPREDMQRTHFQQHRTFSGGDYYNQSRGVPANQYSPNMCRSSCDKYGPPEGFRGQVERHHGQHYHSRTVQEPLCSTSQTGNGSFTPGSVRRAGSHNPTGILGEWQPSGGYCNRDFQNRNAGHTYGNAGHRVTYGNAGQQRRSSSYGNAGPRLWSTNNERQLGSHPRIAPYRGRAPHRGVGGRDIGRPSFHERATRGGRDEHANNNRLEEPHSGGQHSSSEAMSNDLPVPGQRGMKRDWCEAEASDSPHQNNTKVRLAVESVDEPRRQGQDCSTGAASHKLAVPELPEMEREGCKVAASDSPHQNNTEVGSERAYEPHRQGQDGSSGAAPHRLPVPDHPECKAESSCSLCQDNREGRLGSSDQPRGKPQDTSPGAAPHELHVPDQPEMKREECNAEPPDSAHQDNTEASPGSSDQPHRQPEDTSSAAAPRQVAASEQGGMEIDSWNAEAAVIPDINIRLESVEPDS
uniref:Uncharacterized protein n=1 Tax=Avena sativa TaxID=4498 RepID=A0ACD5TIV1_AVESA